MAQYRRLSIRCKSSLSTVLLHLLTNKKVVIGSGAEKRGLNTAVWSSNKVKAQVARYGAGFIFDGNRIGW